MCSPRIYLINNTVKTLSNNCFILYLYLFLFTYLFFVENVMHFQDSLGNKKNSIYLKGIFCNIINVIYCIYYYYV